MFFKQSKQHNVNAIKFSSCKNAVNTVKSFEQDFPSISHLLAPYKFVLHLRTNPENYGYVLIRTKRKNGLILIERNLMIRECLIFVEMNC